jgi:hypothetical protein
MNETKLLRALRDARYKVLVSIRPVAPARSAFNLTLQAIADSLDTMKDKTMRQDVLALKLEETL